MEASMARIDQTRWQAVEDIARLRELRDSRLDEFQRQQPEILLPPPPFRETAI
jgi:hypothetical protein